MTAGTGLVGVGATTGGFTGVVVTDAIVTGGLAGAIDGGSTVTAVDFAVPVVEAVAGFFFL